MRVRIEIIVVIGCIIFWLGGCATNYTVIPIRAHFDLDQATAQLQPGANTIKGSALIRQRGGGVVTCAGLNVQLVPETAYATERITGIYGRTDRGYNPITRPVRFSPENEAYNKAMRTVQCDAQGNFEFVDVKDGGFYVVTSIVWQVGSQPQGGSVMRYVSVSDGEIRQLVLSP